MKPEGIRKVIAEQSLEGAIIYLYEMIKALEAQNEGNKPLAEPAPEVMPYQEGG